MGEFFFRVCTLGGAAGGKKTIEKIKTCKHKGPKTMRLEGETGAME